MAHLKIGAIGEGANGKAQLKLAHMATNHFFAHCLVCLVNKLGQKLLTEEERSDDEEETIELKLPVSEDSLQQQSNTMVTE
uniref:Uncharacterized protein n=1 Tax=Romanomermis culicivorax TaxID=13658 RepID=A0A915KTU6_ROMCU